MVSIKRPKKDSSTDKKLAVQDEFQLKGFELVTWMQEHQGGVLTLIGVVIGLGLLGSVLYYVNNSTNEKASMAFEKGYEQLSDQKKVGNPQEAFKDFEKVWVDNSSSRVSHLAQIEGAKLAFDTQQYDKAISLYQALADKLGSQDTLRPLALTGLAYAYLKSGNQQKALDVFEQFLQIKADINDDVILWQVAQLNQTLGKKDKAKVSAEMLTKQFPSSPYYDSAKRMIAELK